MIPGVLPDTINTTGLNSLYGYPCRKKLSSNSVRRYGPKEWAQVIFMILIMCAGGYLIVYSVYMMTVNHDPTMFMFSIAMFGVGCTTIWFALSHVEIAVNGRETREHRDPAGQDHRQDRETIIPPFF